MLQVTPPDGFDRLLIPMPDGARLLKRIAKPLNVGVQFVYRAKDRPK